MKRNALLAPLLVFSLLGAASAQSGGKVNLNEGVKVLVFPAADARLDLEPYRDLPLVFALNGSQPAYQPSVDDSSGTLRKAFSIQATPTLIVLNEGREVRRFVGQFPKAKTLSLVVEATEAGIIAPQYPSIIRVGDPAPEAYRDFTGLLVFSRESCVWCQREQPILSELCKTYPIRVVSGEGKWAEGCRGELRPEASEAFGVPGTPVTRGLVADFGAVPETQAGYAEEEMERIRLASQGLLEERWDHKEFARRLLAG